LPIWAMVALLAVVVLGMIAKGIHGRARRVTLVESGAGMTRAAVVRFRGFYASSADQLTVRATARGGVLDVASGTDETERCLVIDRDGARLERFRAKPWQTVVVREDGFLSLAGGVSVVKTQDGQLEIKNRLARDLVGVLVRMPTGPAVRYFARIRDGERVKASDGQLLRPLATAAGRGSGLNLDEFAAELNRTAAGLADAWYAFEALAGDGTEWWPSDVPVLLAQVEGGEGRTSDSGMQVDADRLLLRVVGYGGVL